MQKLIIFFLFVSLFNIINADFYNITEKREILSTFKPKTNLGKASDESKISGVKPVNLKKIDGNKVKHTSAAKYEEDSKNNNVSLEILPRVSRYVSKAKKGNLECILCYGSGTTPSDDDCYSGKSLGRANCAESETCYTELHPQYIKRGCILPSNINMTFVCKCPLCNDKPAGDPTYYEYKTISDWQFDNERLEEPLTGLDLLCKVCETTRQNHVTDQICKNGSGSNYMLCGSNQLCFTHVNQRMNFVSRGCTTPPAFNTMKFFCNTSTCNTGPYDNPVKNRRSIAYKFLQKEPILKERKSLASTSCAYASITSNENINFLKMGISSFSILLLGKSLGRM